MRLHKDFSCSDSAARFYHVFTGKGFVESAKQGNNVNDYIRHAKRFRNPDLLEKLVAYMDERGPDLNPPLVNSEP